MRRRTLLSAVVFGCTLLLSNQVAAQEYGKDVEAALKLLSDSQAPFTDDEFGAFAKELNQYRDQRSRVLEELVSMFAKPDGDIDWQGKAEQALSALDNLRNRVPLDKLGLAQFLRDEQEFFSKLRSSPLPKARLELISFRAQIADSSKRLDETWKTVEGKNPELNRMLKDVQAGWLKLLKALPGALADKLAGKYAESVTSGTPLEMLVKITTDQVLPDLKREYAIQQQQMELQKLLWAERERYKEVDKKLNYEQIGSVTDAAVSALTALGSPEQQDFSSKWRSKMLEEIGRQSQACRAGYQGFQEKNKNKFWEQLDERATAMLSNEQELKDANQFFDSEAAKVDELLDKHDAEASKYRDPFKSETRNKIKNLREAFGNVKDTYKTMILAAYQDMKGRMKP
jgi:hypothetical protein